MIGEPDDFWGKVDRDETGEVVEWHPLVDHCADVAACVLAMLQASILRERFSRLAGRDLDVPLIERLCTLAAFHDVGKCNLGFQNKAWANRGATGGHVGPVVDLLGSSGTSKDRFCDAIDAEALEGWGESVVALLLASLCHHGRPVQPGGGPRLRFWQPGYQLDPMLGVAELASATKRWFPLAWQHTEHPLPENPQLQHAFSGLVMLADWLGSDRRFFPYSSSRSDDRFESARPAAQAAIERVGLAPKGPRAQLRNQPFRFEKVAPFEPRPMQRALLESPIDDGRRLVFLEAETGAGKTEAALAWFLRLLREEKVDGLYFALPTRTAGTQLHRRVAEAISRAFPEPGARPPVVLAVPGYLAVDDRTGSRLPGFEVLWNDDEAARYRFRGWAAENPKRYLAGAVVVGTVDQLLLSGLAVNHSHLRATAALRQLLVIDEVHASDAYMTRLTEAVIRRQINSGGWCLLMSATLGAAAFARLARAAGWNTRIPDVQGAIARPYPAVTYVGSEGCSQVDGPPTTGAQKRVVVTLSPHAANPESISGAAIEAAMRGEKVLIIRNTVRECLATQLSLERACKLRGCMELLFSCAGVPAPHHSRFAREDRELLDLALEASFGDGRAEGGCIAVATQTVEQSLDIDADRMITDLCPMDVLLQRLGRLHRHPHRKRSTADVEPQVMVLTPAERDLTHMIQRDGRAFGDHGFGTVYDDLRILEATWQTLEEHQALAVPRMNRLLVEQATHPAELERVVASMPEPWTIHGQYISGGALADVRMASRALADWSTPFDSPDCQFPSTEMGGRIQTRLGEGDRITEFEPNLEGPFGRPVQRLIIPAWLAREAASDAVPRETKTSNGRTVFSFGDKRFAYDRHGLQKIQVAAKDDLGDV